MCMWVPKGLTKCTIDRWKAVRDYRVIDYFICSYSIRWDNPPKHWPDGPEFRCCYEVGHSGDHKWFDSDEHGDYDIWIGSSKYDYQLEEL